MTSEDFLTSSDVGTPPEAPKTAADFLSEPSQSADKFLNSPGDASERFLTEPENTPDAIRQRLYAPGSTALASTEEAHALRTEERPLTDRLKGAAMAVPQGVKQVIEDVGTQAGKGHFREEQNAKGLTTGQDLLRGAQSAWNTSTEAAGIGELVIADLLRKGFRGLQNAGAAAQQNGAFTPFAPVPRPTDLDLDKLKQQKINEDLATSRRLEEIRAGKESSLPWRHNNPELVEKGELNPEYADIISLGYNPAVLGVAGDAARLARAGEAFNPLERSAAQTVGGAAGRGIQALGRKVSQAASLPEQAGQALSDRLPYVKLGEDAADGAKPSTLGTVGLAHAAEAVGVPVGTIALGLKAGQTGGKVAEQVGKAIEVGSEASTRSGLGFFQQMGMNEAAPQWIRAAAKQLEPLDGGVHLGTDLTKSAAHGAAINTILALPGAETPEEVGQAAGTGIALGGVTHLALRPFMGEHIRRAAEDYDLTRWFGRRDPSEQAALSGWSREAALRAATAEVVANGITKDSNVKFVYQPDVVFAEKHGATRGVAVDLSGDQPTIYINADRATGQTMGHELFHALRAADVKGTADLVGKITPIVGPDGKTIVKPGFVTPEEFTRRTDEYLSRLSPENRVKVAGAADYDPMKGFAGMPSDLKSYIANEMGAELMGSLPGASPSGLLRDIGSGSRRVMDYLLTREQDSWRNKLGRGLEKVLGRGNDETSEIFRGMKASPEVGAMLRDVVRERNKISKPLTFDEDSADASVTIPRAEFMRPGSEALRDIYADSDLFAKDANSPRPDKLMLSPTGNAILMSAGDIRRVQANRQQMMADALSKVPDSGEVGAMRLQPNGAWSGTHFTDAQLAALKAIPENILTPSMHGKILEMNRFLKENGKPFLIHYNAALNHGQYSSRIKESVRTGVPIRMAISKAGNFYMETLDLTGMFSKLNRWDATKKNVFADFGSKQQFVNKLYDYLHNHEANQPGMTGLDADPAKAKRMANRINDFLNMYDAGTEGANQDRLSTKSNKDVLLRSRRFDRINRIEDANSDNTPLNYGYVKQNFSVDPDSAWNDVVASAQRERETPGASDRVRFSPTVPGDGAQLEREKPLPHTVGPETIKIVHFTGNAGLKTLDPKYFGKGSANPNDLRGGDKSYAFVIGSDFGQDQNIFNQKFAFAAKVSGSGLYDLRKGMPDPLGYFSTLNREQADDMLRSKGYTGILVDTVDKRKVVTLYRRIAVTPVGKGTGGSKAVLEKGTKFSPDAAPQGEKETPADYLGYQEGYGSMKGFHLFNLTRDVEGLGVKDSTISEEKLRAAGFNPQVPAASDRFSPDSDERGTKRASKPGMPISPPGTPAFKKWFGESKVVDKAGKPLVVYHGTTHEFTEFTKERANIGNDHGAGFYFTNRPQDANQNYARKGPDLTNRIESRIDSLQSQFDLPYKEAEQRAKAEVMGPHKGAIVPTFLSLKNPVELGGPNETRFEFDHETETGSLIDFANSLRKVATEFHDVDAEKLVQDIFEHPDSYDGMKAFDLIEHLKESEGLSGATDDAGELASSEIIRRAFEGMGFDGIIDRRVNEKFGRRAVHGGYGPPVVVGMKGMNPDTAHYVAFHPEQVKSVFNQGTFNPKKADIRLSPDVHPTEPLKLEDRVVNNFASRILAIHNSNPEAKGSTFNVAKGRRIDGTGFAVSIFPERSLIVDGDPTKEQIAGFIKKNSDILGDPQNCVGTWFDPESKKTYVDVSLVSHDRGFAEFMGKRYNQKSIADLEKIKTGDFDNAFPNTGGTGEPIDGMPAEALRVPDGIAEFKRLGGAAKEAPKEESSLMPQSAVNVLHRDSDVLPPPGKAVLNEDVAAALQSVAVDYWGKVITSDDVTPEQTAELVDNGTAEVKAALAASGKNAGDWYTHSVERAEAIAGVLHPELHSDEAAKATGVFPDKKAANLGLFIAMAATSQNTKVELNTRYTEEQFQALKTTGKFDDSKVYGEKAKSISGNLDLANRMISRYGWDGVDKFLSQDFSVRDLSKIVSDILGEKTQVAGRLNDAVQGSAVFGPKIGQGFLQNLRGNYKPVTVDLWMRRTWGRWTGDVLGAGITPERLARLLDAARAQKIALPDQLKTLRSVYRDRETGSKFRTLSERVADRVETDGDMRKVIFDFSSSLALDWQARYRAVHYYPVRPSDAAALREGSLTMDQLSDRQTRLLDALNTQWSNLKDKPKGAERKGAKDRWLDSRFEALGYTEKLTNAEISENKPEWAKAAIVIKTQLKPKDAPSDQDHEVISKVVNGIRSKLEAEGLSTSNADIQAILWYPEKDLWAKLRGEPESNLKTSYDEEFLKLAEARGLGKEARAAAEAVDRARAARNSSGSDAGAARPAGGPHDGAPGDQAPGDSKAAPATSGAKFSPDVALTTLKEAFVANPAAAKAAVDKFAAKGAGFDPRHGKTLGLSIALRTQQGQKFWEHMTPQERFAEFEDYAKKDFHEFQLIPPDQREEYMVDRAFDWLDPMSGVYKILLQSEGYEVTDGKIKRPTGRITTAQQPALAPSDAPKFSPDTGWRKGWLDAKGKYHAIESGSHRDWMTDNMPPPSGSKDPEEDAFDKGWVRVLREDNTLLANTHRLLGVAQRRALREMAIDNGFSELIQDTGAQEKTLWSRETPVPSDAPKFSPDVVHPLQRFERAKIVSAIDRGDISMDEFVGLLPRMTQEDSNSFLQRLRTDKLMALVKLLHGSTSFAPGENQRVSAQRYIHLAVGKRRAALETPNTGATLHRDDDVNRMPVNRDAARSLSAG